MKKNHFCLFFIFTLLNCYGATSYAWNHSIELGYGYSHDPNHTKFNNSGLLLSGDIIPLWRRTPWTFFSLTGSLGRWRTTASHNQNLTTAAASLALRVYPFKITTYEYPPYVFASFGPAYLSSRKFGENTQGSHLSIQSILGLGFELHCVDVNLRAVHYSNAHLASPNEGFNILYLLSIGYLL